MGRALEIGIYVLHDQIRWVVEILNILQENIHLKLKFDEKTVYQ